MYGERVTTERARFRDWGGILDEPGAWINQESSALPDLLLVPRSAALCPSKGMECKVAGASSHALIQVRFSSFIDQMWRFTSYDSYSIIFHIKSVDQDTGILVLDLLSDVWTPHFDIYAMLRPSKVLVHPAADSEAQYRALVAAGNVVSFIQIYKGKHW